MAHSRPTKIANRGDATRITHAAGAFIIELATDRRVQELNRQWRAMRTRGGQMLDVMLSRGKQSDVPQIEAWMNQVNARELEETQRFVRTELRLPDAWVAWISDSLLHLQYLALYNSEHPDDQQKFSVPVFLTPDTPQGKMPQKDAQDIVRNVRWFYRVHVQQPPEAVHDLARDYQSWANRTNDCRSVVQNGIKQAKVLLDLVAARAVRMPPERLGSKEKSRPPPPEK